MDLGPTDTDCDCLCQARQRKVASGVVALWETRGGTSVCLSLTARPFPRRLEEQKRHRTPEAARPLKDLSALSIVSRALRISQDLDLLPRVIVQGHARLFRSPIQPCPQGRPEESGAGAIAHPELLIPRHRTHSIAGGRELPRGQRRPGVAEPSASGGRAL
eukprot:7867668-Pyramimonas_sp.AAC.1